MFRSRRRTLTAVILTAVAVASLTAVPAHATPPGIPSKATAQSQLNGLTVAAEGSSSGYSRDLFPHWITISGACNTRETVLRRDGSGVVVNSSCAATSGSWYSPYDGANWTNAADVDIDHIVPLSEAWRRRRTSLVGGDTIGGRGDAISGRKPPAGFRAVMTTPRYRSIDDQPP
jgi:hypothetical protein